MSVARFRELYDAAQEMNGLEDFGSPIPDGCCQACDSGYEDASLINAVRNRLYHLLDAIRDGGDLAALDAAVPSAEVIAAMRRITSSMHVLKRQGVFEYPETHGADLDRIDAYLAAQETT